MKKLTKNQRRILLRALSGRALPAFSHTVAKLKEKGLIRCYWSTERAERALRPKIQCKKRKRRSR